MNNLRLALRVFEDIGIMRGESWALTSRDGPERLRGASISATLFSLLGTSPLLGRGFQRDEDQPGSEPVVVLRSD